MALHEAAGRCTFPDCDGGGEDLISITKTLDTDPEWLAAPVSSDSISGVLPARRRRPGNRRPTSALFVRRRALLSLVSCTAEVVYAKRSDAFVTLRRHNNVQLDGKPMKIEMLNHNSEVLASPRINVIGGMNGWSARKVVLNVMFARLANDGTDFEEMREHVNDFADVGLRTLILAYRELDEEEYREFNEKFSEAINYVSADQESLMDQVAETIEKDLVLGATAVEDKLQCGVPECIDKLAQAGIKIWVLTGDKMETTINIGYACSLLRQGVKQIIINLETPDIKVLEKSGDKEAIIKVSKDSVLEQINQGKAQLKGPTSSGAGSEAFALIIDGKSLVYALEDDIQNSFMKLAINCASELITLDHHSHLNAAAVCYCCYCVLSCYCVLLHYCYCCCVSCAAGRLLLLVLQHFLC